MTRALNRRSFPVWSPHLVGSRRGRGAWPQRLAVSRGPAHLRPSAPGAHVASRRGSVQDRISAPAPPGQKSSNTEGGSDSGAALCLRLSLLCPGWAELSSPPGQAGLQRLHRRHPPQLLTAPLGGGCCCYYPNVADGNNEAQRG